MKHYTVWYVDEGGIYSQIWEVDAWGRVEAFDAFLATEIPHKYVAMVLCDTYEGSEY